jgi:hypothetical protein
MAAPLEGPDPSLRLTLCHGVDVSASLGQHPPVVRDVT